MQLGVINSENWNSPVTPLYIMVVPSGPNTINDIGPDGLDGRKATGGHDEGLMSGSAEQAKKASEIRIASNKVYIYIHDVYKILQKVPMEKRDGS